MKKIIIAAIMMGMTGGAYAGDFGELAVKAEELKAAAAAEGGGVKTENIRFQAVESGKPGDRQAELLLGIEEMKEKIRKYGDDPVRAGIYHAELSLLYVELANLCFAGNDLPADAPSGRTRSITAEARLEEPPVYNHRLEARPMSRVCKLLKDRGADIGRTTSVRCTDRGNGIIELEASDSSVNKAKSISADPTGKTRVESRGADYVHSYRNSCELGYECSRD